MKICPICGTTNTGETTQCSKCGASLGFRTKDVISKPTNEFQTSRQVYEHLKTNYGCTLCKSFKPGKIKKGLCSKCRTKKIITTIIMLILAFVIYGFVEFQTDLWFNPAYKKPISYYSVAEHDLGFDAVHWILCILLLLILIVLAFVIPSNIFSGNGFTHTIPCIPNFSEESFNNSKHTQKFLLSSSEAKYIDNLKSLYKKELTQISCSIKGEQVTILFNNSPVGFIPEKEAIVFLKHKKVTFKSAAIYEFSDCNYVAAIECSFT